MSMTSVFNPGASDPEPPVTGLLDGLPPHGPTAPVSSFVTYENRWILVNGGRTRVAMSAKRIRIGCTEISIEAAREIIQQHGMRFGKPPEEVWQTIQ